MKVGGGHFPHVILQYYYILPVPVYGEQKRKEAGSQARGSDVILFEDSRGRAVAQTDLNLLISSVIYTISKDHVLNN